MNRDRIPTILAAVMLSFTAIACSKPTAPVTSGDLEKLAAARERNQQQEALSLARSMYMELLDTGSRIRGDLETLGELHRQWEAEILALLSTEDGRFLTAEQGDVVSFRSYVQTMKAVTQSSLEVMTSELNALTGPAKEIIDSGAIAGTPDPELSIRLAALENRVKSTLEPYLETVPAMQAMLATAKQRGVRGESTLQQAVDALNYADAQDRTTQVEAARKAAEAEVTAKLAEAEQALVRARGEQQLQALMAEESHLRDRMQADALKARASSPDTLKRLEPFVTKAAMSLQTPRPFVYQWQRVRTETRPLSFSAIAGHKALEPTEDGLRYLHEIANSTQNDRPAWPIASTKEHWDWVRENQTLLRELGTTLVELGHLDP
ncbi:MAG: hypothetical protein KF886_23470 [Candidatus Hydrogenedentes bacterium]|nr:hypothetical protein [Candidatus Hydrogenedentota bacterium]